MRLRSVGSDAVLVEVGTVEEAMAVYAAARAAGIGAREIVPAARTVLFDGVDAAGREWLLEQSGRGDRSSDLPPGERPTRSVTIPTVYDGPDLEAAASVLRLSPDELVSLHTRATFTVAFCGFAPGFAYCTGLGLEVPRLETPRPRVEPGSVGLAGEFTGIYPSASPGGWQLIGRTAISLWDAAAAEPALLTPGTRVRFQSL